MKNLDDYRPIVGDETIDEIWRRAQRFQGRKIVHINSTGEGGGVAEILKSLVPLMNHVGIKAEWLVLDGNDDFFALTKEFHNALQGGAVNLDEKRERLYLQTNQTFAAKYNIDADCVVVHDPQPLPLIGFYDKSQPWVWRCHVDLSHPNTMLWEFLKDFIVKYDVAIMSHNGYRKQDLPIEQRIIYPAIDPLSTKNISLSEDQIADYITKACIPADKPVITQVSRMDLWKDPEGLLDVFEHIRREVDCRLIYCYSSSIDDPEGLEVLTRTYRKAGKLVETGDVLFVEGTDQTLVNAIQRF